MLHCYSFLQSVISIIITIIIIIIIIITTATVTVTIIIIIVTIIIIITLMLSVTIINTQSHSHNFLTGGQTENLIQHTRIRRVNNKGLGVGELKRGTTHMNKEGHFNHLQEHLLNCDAYFSSLPLKSCFSVH